MDEILQRLLQKTEDLIAKQGATYFMCGGDLLNIISSVQHDIDKGIPVAKWDKINSIEDLKLNSKSSFRHFTSNNCQWNEGLDAHSYDGRIEDQIRKGYVMYKSN